VKSARLADGFDAVSTGSRVDYVVLAPADRGRGECLPLVLHLHGAMSSAASLDAAKDAYDDAWSRGELPRAIVACASTPTHGGFYIDHVDGPRWEALVSDELARVVGERFDLDGRRVAIGFSMGGYGALKMAFRNPSRFVAVAALCPVIFPGETPTTVPERSRPSILGELHLAMGEGDELYARNSVYGVARAEKERIRATRLRIFVDCGQADEFGLHDGAVYLHRVLDELAIDHEFHSLPGAGHADAAAAGRQANAIRFLGRALADTTALGG
jgi:S-formylglutathione hydrolase